MKWFLVKYREGSKVSRIAFWVVLVSAVVGLASIPIGRQLDHPGSLSVVTDCLNAVMFLGLGVQGFSLWHDRRRPRELSWTPPKQTDRF